MDFLALSAVAMFCYKMIDFLYTGLKVGLLSRTPESRI